MRDAKFTPCFSWHNREEINLLDFGCICSGLSFLRVVIVAITVVFVLLPVGVLLVLPGHLQAHSLHRVGHSLDSLHANSRGLQSSVGADQDVHHCCWASPGPPQEQFYGVHAGPISVHVGSTEANWVI